VVFGVVLFGVAACSKSAGDPNVGAPSTPTPESGSAAGPASTSCDVIAARFRTALSATAGTCRTDADCACYNPVITEAGCGGITDATTAAQLAAIEREFHAASCPWPHQCAAMSCQPHCASGRCAQ